MKRTLLIAFAATVAVVANAQSFSDDFEVDSTANWTVNGGPTDESADFFYDYSAVGVPSAPNSGGTTSGMKLQANLTSSIFGGFSVSPTGESFSGDYVPSFPRPLCSSCLLPRE